MLNLRACYELSDLSINRTIKFSCKFVKFRKKKNTIIPQHISLFNDFIEINATFAL